MNECGHLPHYAKGLCRPCYDRRWVRANPDKRRKHLYRSNLKRRYGITPEQQADMYERQGGLCAICDVAMDDPQTDHDHKTGRVRGLLCSFCNARVLPTVENCAELIERARKYLSRSA